MTQQKPPQNSIKNRRLLLSLIPVFVNFTGYSYFLVFEHYPA